MLVSFHVYLKWGFNTIVPQCYFPYILWKHTNFQSSAFSEIWKRPKTNRLKLKICSEFKIQKNENLVDCSRFHGDCHQFNCSHGWCSSVTTTHGKNWHNKFHYIHHECGHLIICWTVDIGHIQMKIFAICLKIPFYFLSFFIISVRTKKTKQIKVAKSMMEVPQWHCLRYFKHDIHLMRRCRNYRVPMLRRPLED